MKQVGFMGNRSRLDPVIKSLMVTVNLASLSARGDEYQDDSLTGRILPPDAY